MPDLALLSPSVWAMTRACWEKCILCMSKNHSTPDEINEKLAVKYNHFFPVNKFSCFQTVQN